MHLFFMIHDYAHKGSFNPTEIIDALNYGTKTDKAFSISGRQTNSIMQCPELLSPRVTKSEIKQIILGGGERFLSPERRFDAALVNSPGLF